MELPDADTMVNLKENRKSTLPAACTLLKPRG
jgi:hypothetical protein